MINIESGVYPVIDILYNMMYKPGGHPLNVVRNHSPLYSKREFVPKSISNDQIQQIKNQIVTDINLNQKNRNKNFSQNFVNQAADKHVACQQYKRIQRTNL